MVGVAVKVTLVPAQMVLFVALEVMLTLTGKLELTVADTAVLVREIQPVIVFLVSA